MSVSLILGNEIQALTGAFYNLNKYFLKHRGIKLQHGSADQAFFFVMSSTAKILMCLCVNCRNVKRANIKKGKPAADLCSFRKRVSE